MDQTTETVATEQQPVQPDVQTTTLLHRIKQQQNSQRKLILNH